MYRIQSLTITGLLLFVGCGSPQAGDVYELEKRVAQTEQAQQEISERLGREAAPVTGDSGESDRLDARLSKIERSMDVVLQRVKEVEANNPQGKPSTSQQTPTPRANAADAGLLESRFDRLEAKVTRLATAVSTAQPTSRPESTDSEASALSDMKEVAEVKPLVGTRSKTKKKSGKKGQFSTTLFSWNVESEGSDPQLIAQQLAAMNRYDIYGLCEVLPESVDLYTNALGDDYRSIATRSGYNDRLQIIYNDTVYKLLRRMELKEINFENRYRSPLVAHLEHRATGQQLMVLNNHLARGRPEVRTKQAQQLVEWAREQTVPIVAVGDYNFDYVFSTRKGNDGFNAMLKDNVWKWLEPVELIDTNWFDNPKRPDGRDDYEGSMLDFAFVANAATEWNSQCRVIVREGDFPDDETTSDHRPFELLLETP